VRFVALQLGDRFLKHGLGLGRVAELALGVRKSRQSDRHTGASKIASQRFLLLCLILVSLELDDGGAMAP
jgi:hypothetical protein